MPANFKRKKPIKASIKIVLRDLFDCRVHLKRLSKSEIERATKPSFVANQSKNIQLPSSNCEAHSNGTLEISVPTPSSTPSQTPTQTNGLHSPARSISLCSSYSSSFSDSDTDNDCVDDEPYGYDLNLDDIDATTTQQNVVRPTNGFVILNGTDIDIKSNGMDAHYVESDDDDDDLRFLSNFKAELDQTEGNSSLAENCDENNRTWPSNRIFDNICLKSLIDQCYNPYCDYSHTFPSPETVESRLKTASWREIDELQNNLLLRYEALMSRYFTVFCTHCGREWEMHRENLRLMISLLSTKPSATAYLKDIVHGFLISGIKYSTCVNQLFLEIDESLDIEGQFNILWPIIIDTRNDKVNDHLKTFESVLYGDALVNTDAINKILMHQINDEMLDVRELAVNLVKKCRLATFQRINPVLLQKYVWHVRVFDFNTSRAIQQRAGQFGLTLDNH